MKKCILIVEDEIVLRDVYEMILATNEDYDIVTANNGLEGFEQLRKHKPDIILLDLFMPVMDGFSFLQNYDEQEFPSTKIIVYSNMSDTSAREEAYSLGAHDFILKSDFNPKQLLEFIEKTLV